MLAHTAEADRGRLWRGTGAGDMAHYLWMRQGISDWKARRWVAAAHALEHLPAISQAFATGELSIDKVVELTRFATPETERGLIPWAKRVSCGAIRHRGDLASRALEEETLDANRGRELTHWTEGARMKLEADFPVAEGAIVVNRIEEEARNLPVMPGEDGPLDAAARRADALVAICLAKPGEAADAHRATVVVHASLDALAGTQGAEIERGPVISSAGSPPCRRRRGLDPRGDRADPSLPGRQRTLRPDPGLSGHVSRRLQEARVHLAGGMVGTSSG